MKPMKIPHPLPDEEFPMAVKFHSDCKTEYI